MWFIIIIIMLIYSLVFYTSSNYYWVIEKWQQIFSKFCSFLTVFFKDFHLHGSNCLSNCHYLLYFSWVLRGCSPYSDNEWQDWTLYAPQIPQRLKSLSIFYVLSDLPWDLPKHRNRLWGMFFFFFFSGLLT